MSFLLLSQPIETSLRILQYDPEKLKKPKASKRRAPTTKHLPSNIDKQTGAHRTLQGSDLGAFTENPPRSLMSRTSSAALGPEACEVSSHYSVSGINTYQLMRQRIQYGSSIVKSRGVSPGLRTADQRTFGAECDPAQVEFVGRQILAAALD